MKPLVYLLAVLALSVHFAGCANTQSAGSGTRGADKDDPGARIHTELAAGYFQRAQYDVALQELRIALASDKSYAPAYSILGLVHAELREDKEAEQHFRRAIDLSPNFSDAHNNFALFLCQRGRHAESLKHSELALANPLYTTPEKALANAGNCALEKGDPAQAELYFVRALKRAPNLAAALLGMAEIHYRNARWLAARSVLRQYGGQFSEQAAMGPQALWLGVRAERMLGDREAEANYGSILRRHHPESPQAQWLISGQYEQAGSLL
jgi:type IV pilus assembly protein PilF